MLEIAIDDPEVTLESLSLFLGKILITSERVKRINDLLAVQCHLFNLGGLVLRIV